MKTVYIEKPAILATELDRARDGLIEASAGTGKTYTIEHLVIDLIIEEGAKLGEILVVTFTEKATAELRRRVLAKIRQILTLADRGESDPLRNPAFAWRIDDIVRRRLQEATLALETANISTIHGFCNSVLREFAFENGQPFQLEQVDANLLLEDVYPRFVRRELLSGSDARMGRVAAYLADKPRGLEIVEPKGLFEVIRGVIAKQGTILPDLAVASKLVERLLESFKTLPIPDWNNLNVPSNQPAKFSSEWQALKNVLEEHADPIDTLCALTMLKKRTKRAKSVLTNPLNWSFNKKPKPGYINQPNDLPQAFVTWHDLLQDALNQGIKPDMALVAEVLPTLRTMLREEKERRAAIDFDDMIRLVAEKLEGDGGQALVAALRAKYRFALIDEFQDTDANQWAIFSKIFLESTDHRLFLIGDPKQAIYSFRGADIHVYLAARDILANRGGQILNLRDNYRSTPHLLNGINELFDGSDFFGESIAYTPVGVGRPQLQAGGVSNPPLRCLNLVPEPDQSFSKADLDHGFGHWIAAEIETLLNSMTLPSDNGNQRPLRPRDIAVLVRKRAEADIIGDLLKKAGIAFSFYKQGGLFQSAEALDLLDLLQAIANPGDESACLRALLTPFFPVSFTDLSAAPIVPDLYRRWFSEWHHLMAKHRDPRRLFENVFERTRVLERRILLENDERAITNYEHITDILEREGSHSNTRQLVRLLRSLIEGRFKLKDQDYLRLESSREAVQVMTVHASKGLEFPVVFLFGGFSESPTSGFHEYFDQELGRVVDLGGNHKSEHEAEQDLERRRLAYVAATRAAFRLYIPFWEKNALKRQTAKQPLIDRLRDYSPRFAAIERRSLAERDMKTAPPKTAAVQTPIKQTQLQPVRDETYRTLLKRKNRFQTSSYTRLAHHGTFDAGLFNESWSRARAQDERDDELGSAASVLPKGRETGICLHEILEYVDELAVYHFSRDEFLAWERQEHVRLLLTEHLVRFDLEHAHDTVAEIIWHALTRPIFQNIAIGDLPAQDRLHEVDFFFPMSVGDGVQTVLNGSMDLAFRIEGRYFFGDWKSDTLENYRSDYLAEKVSRDYNLQIQIYTLALLLWLKIESETDFEQRFGGVYYLFLRGMTKGEGIYFFRPTWDEVQTYRGQLLERLERSTHV